MCNADPYNMGGNFLRISQKRLTRSQKKEVKQFAGRFRVYFAGAALAIYGLYCISTGMSPLGTTAPFPNDQAHARRLSGGGCPDWVAGQGGGHVVGYLVMTLYMFLGLALVCDDWFMPSLEKISETLNLSADVAGATFLAAGSSAPEFFTSLADTFSTSNSVGVGTIVGSAMFNILVIVAMAAASTKETLNIDWRPVCRDCGFYGVSIATLIIFFQDGQIHWWEGLIMTGVYFLYIVFMVFNAKIFKMCEKVKVEPDPAYAPGRRKSVHHHKGMFQGKVREVQLVDGTEGVLDEDKAVIKTEDGKEIAVQSSENLTAIATSDAENPAADQPPPPNGEPPNAALEEADKENPAADEKDEKAESGGDDDDGDPDNYMSHFEWSVDLQCIFIFWLRSCLEHLFSHCSFCFFFPFFFSVFFSGLPMMVHLTNSCGLLVCHSSCCTPSLSQIAAKQKLKSTISPHSSCLLPGLVVCVLLWFKQQRGLDVFLVLILSSWELRY